jgi:multimeric flavodoxin WrbA
MKLIVSCSNRKENCFRIAQSLKDESDELISLSGKNIRFCSGCDACANKLDSRCIQIDDMQDIYRSLEIVEKIVFIIPIYFENINGLFKNFIDRLNPFYHHNLLQDKEVFFITIGEASEDENSEVVKDLKSFFSKLSSGFGFSYKYLRNFSCGESGRVEDNYEDFNQIIDGLKGDIG